MRLRPSTVARAPVVVAAALVIASITGQVAKYGHGHDHVYGLLRLTSVGHERRRPPRHLVVHLVIPGIAIVGLLALYFIRFVWRLPPKTRSGFVIAGTMFVAGVVGVETLGGWHGGLHGLVNLPQYQRRSDGSAHRHTGREFGPN